jgi:hypothetical protein
LRLLETCRIEGLIRLLLAAVERHSGTLVDDLVALNEQRVFLRGAVSLDSQTCEPSGAAQVVDRPHGRDLEGSEAVRTGKSRPDVIGNDLPIVGLREILRDRGIGQTLGEMAASGATRQAQT